MKNENNFLAPFKIFEKWHIEIDIEKCFLKVFQKKKQITFLITRDDALSYETIPIAITLTISNYHCISFKATSKKCMHLHYI